MQNRNALVGFFVIIILLIVGILIASSKSNSVSSNKNTQQSTIISPLPSNTITTTESPSPSPSISPSMMQENSFILSGQNISNENGNVTISEKNGKVIVMITLSNAPASPQPAHIHSGSCPNPGAVIFPLTSVVNGKSQTTLDTTLEALKKQQPLAINVHKSAAEISTYVSCGDLKL